MRSMLSGSRFDKDLKRVGGRRGGIYFFRKKQDEPTVPSRFRPVARQTRRAANPRGTANFVRSRRTHMNLTYQILKNHLVEGELTPGREISIRIDQTLTQDSTGTMAYLQFEAMGVPRVKTERSVAYIDHNTLQNGV